MDTLQQATPENTDIVADIPVEVEARFEERLMDVRDVLAIRPGLVIPLSRPAGETLTFCVGNVRLASAEVVVIEDRLALRITEFERMES
jgi:flagellar motor switch protein FliN/FliY